MGIYVLTGFFMWCTVINGAMLLFSTLMCLLASDMMYGVHSKLFSISRESFNVAIYSFLGLFKIFFIVLNLVPYVALLIVG